MKYLSIKEWETYQHYSKRHPPWIKLHVKILRNYAYRCLQDASKGHLLSLFALASQYENRIPYDLAFITEMIGAREPVDVEELVLQGFIELSQDDGATLAPRKQVASKPLAPKTETETEKRSERYAFMGVLKPVWKSKYGGDMPKGAARDLAPVNEEIGTEALVRRLTNYIAATEAAYVSIPRFKQTHGAWDTPKTNGVLRLDKEARDQEQFRKRGYVV